MTVLVTVEDNQGNAGPQQRAGCEEIIRYASEYARNHGRKKSPVCGKTTS